MSTWDLGRRTYGGFTVNESQTKTSHIRDDHGLVLIQTQTGALAGAALVGLGELNPGHHEREYKSSQLKKSEFRDCDFQNNLIQHIPLTTNIL